MVATTEQPRLLNLYRETVAPKVMQEFGLSNRHQLPRLAHLQWCQLYPPVPIVVGAGYELLAGELHRDLLAWRGLAPDRHLAAAL